MAVRRSVRARTVRTPPGGRHDAQFECRRVGSISSRLVSPAAGRESMEAAGACDGGKGAICATLADARAREALAEQQLVELNHRMANLLQAVVMGIERQRLP